MREERLGQTVLKVNTIPSGRFQIDVFIFLMVPKKATSLQHQLQLSFSIHWCVPLRAKPPSLGGGGAAHGQSAGGWGWMWS